MTQKTFFFFYNRENCNMSASYHTFQMTFVLILCLSELSSEYLEEEVCGHLLNTV